ncbi:MAG TPA: ABC transporter permease [Bryobacteraceae bacterium]|nr:ABC transporter permease [Bryobacteraceae bacterium]
MALYQKLANVFREHRLSRELDDELKFHMAELVDDLVAGGMSEEEARREATRRFGNYTVQKERTRDMDIAAWLDQTVADLRYGIRQLRQSPGFTAVGVLSLALGIGANTAMFQLLDNLRLRQLPVKDPAQLVTLDKGPKFTTSGFYSARNSAFTYAQYQQILAKQQAFEDVLAFGTRRFNMSKGGEVRWARGLYISSNFLSVLGVTPLLGRGPSVDDEKGGCAGAGALLDYAFWQRQFGGKVSALGQTIHLEGRDFPIIGVTPPHFFGVEPGYRFDVAVPLCADSLIPERGPSRLEVKHAWWLTFIGRLKPGWTLERASQHLTAISPAIFRETVPEIYRPDIAKRYMENKFVAKSASAGVSYLRQRYENPLWILLAITGLVLLIACANLANLLLARASAREREVAVRQAIGASRGRLIAQLLSESLLLAMLGAIAGALLAQALSRSLVTFLNGTDGDINMALGVDWRVFAFTAALALLTCLLFGLAPAIRASGTQPASAMRGGRGSTSTSERNGLRRLLVVSQIALSLVLLVGALLFGRSLQNILNTGTGMDPEGVLVASIDARLPKLDPPRRRAVFQQLEDRMRQQPGVLSAASVFITPFSGAGWNNEVFADHDKSSNRKESWFNRVSPGYFDTLNVGLLAGRDFNVHDRLNSPKVAIVNEIFAQRVFDGKNPVGRSFRVEGDAGKEDEVFEIVGYVKNTKYNGIREDLRAIAYLPVAQEPDPHPGITILMRTRGSISGLMSQVRQVMTELNPSLLVDFSMLDVQARESITRERLIANLSAGFGLLAAALSTLGLYGVISYMVVRRRNELGVRIALGAESRDILGLILQEAGRLIVIGLIIGLVGSLAVSRFAESLLFGLKPNDPVTLVIACVLLALTAVVATLFPARKAMTLDPAAVLREE